MSVTKKIGPFEISLFIGSFTSNHYVYTNTSISKGGLTDSLELFGYGYSLGISNAKS